MRDPAQWPVNASSGARISSGKWTIEVGVWIMSRDCRVLWRFFRTWIFSNTDSVES